MPNVVLRALGTVELTGDGGRSLQSILHQPKRFALLAYLAVSTPLGFRRRESLMALLWPDLDEEHARAALRKALFTLRHELGDGAIVGRGDDEIRVAREVVWCDAAAFGDALGAGHFEEAFALYRGELLPGFHVADASAELSHWLDDERTRLRGQAAGAAWRLADQREQAGDVLGARDWSFRAAHLEPLDESVCRRLVVMLDRLGDRSAAIRAYDAFARRLRDQLDLEPSAETLDLVQSIRERPSPELGVRPGPHQRGLESARATAALAAERIEQAAESTAPITDAALSHRNAVHKVRWRQRLILLPILLVTLVASGVLLAPRVRKPLSVPREALTFYERGLAYIASGRERDRERQWRLAVEMLNRAVTAAPDFAEAHAALGMAHLRLFHWGYDRTTARQALSRAAIDRSLSIDSTSPEALMARGWYYEWGEKDHERALIEAKRVLERIPDHADAATLVGSASRRMGKAAEAIRFLRRAVSLSAQNVSLRRELSNTYIGLRSYGEAMALLDESLTLFPGDRDLYYYKWLAALLGSGLIAADEVLKDAWKHQVSPDATWQMEFDLRWLNRDYAAALRVLERAKPDSFHIQVGDLPIQLLYGMVHRLAGNETLAREAYRESIPGLRRLIDGRPGEPWFHGWLAVAMAGAGEPVAALREAKLSTDLSSLDPDQWANPYLMQEVVLHAYLMAGERDLAISTLSDLLGTEYYGAISREWLSLDPRFDGLRQHARFQSLLPGGRSRATALIARDSGSDDVAGGARTARTTIAVLPFENLSARGPHGDFARGLHHDLLTQLSKVAALRVIDRETVKRFVGENAPPLRQVAKKLAVGSIVEASVQVLGDRLRVNARVVDVATGTYVWTERYDRTLDDAFAIQSDLAQRIVGAVGATLTGAERTGLTEPPTRSPEAYRFYFQGREYATRPGYVRQNLEIAERLYQRAVALDSTFALARAALSILYGSTRDPFGAREYRVRQREQAEAALRLAPGLPEAHLAIGVADYRDGQPQRALAAFARALEALPNDGELWVYIAATHRSMGNWSKAIATFETAASLAPRNADLNADLFEDQGGNTFRLVHRYADAVREYDRALAHYPDFSSAAINRGWVYAMWSGSLDTLSVALRTGEPRYQAEYWRFLLWQRQGDSLLHSVRARGAPCITCGLYIAWAHRLRGDYLAASAAFDSARLYLASRLEQSPTDYFIRTMYALALAGAGRPDEALRETEIVKKILVDKSAFVRVQWTEDYARTLAQAGETNAALDVIERLLTGPSWFTSAHTLRLDPLWDGIRDHPRFKSLLVKHAMP